MSSFRKSSVFFFNSRSFTTNSPVIKGNPKIFRKIVFGSLLSAYGYYQWEHYYRNIELAQKLDIPFYKVLMYKAFPFSAMSSLAGWAGNLKIESIQLRKLLFGLYSKVYGCNLEEADKPLEAYKSFGEFFARPLKRGARVIEKVNGLVNACDGKLLHCGEIEGNLENGIYPEQVKGSLYPLKDLIGEDSISKITRKPGTSFFYCTIYLAPGDYHRFHAPTKIRVDSVKEFSGEVLSVAPFMMKAVPKLLCMNERVAINGRWKYGFISYVPVGAANVGSIVINPDVKESNMIQSGSEIGHFELGSTVVMIFEAPIGSKWEIEPGQSIKLGQPLLTVPAKSWWQFF